MGRVFPFRGYRYDSSRIGRLEDVVTQPYDKITSSMLEEYLQRHPHNIARVIRNSNYEEAGEHLLNWVDDGVMKQDGEPCFYPYEQVFELGSSRVSRLGFICLTSLGDSNLTVRGHERVLQAPLQDRLDLIRQTRSNEGLIFMLHSQPSMRVEHDDDGNRIGSSQGVCATQAILLRFSRERLAGQGHSWAA